MTLHTLPVTPMGAPRMTRRDKWKRRPCVVEYFAFRDAVRAESARAGLTLPDSGYHVTFYLPPPASWSAKKKAAHEGQPHQSKPDKDNLEKALLDALFEDDSHVWDGRATKRWSVNPRIEIEVPASVKVEVVG